MPRKKATPQPVKDPVNRPASLPPADRPFRLSYGPDGAPYKVYADGTTEPA